MITRDQLEASVEEVTIGDKFTGQFRVNYDTLVDVEKCVRMAKVIVQTNKVPQLIFGLTFLEMCITSKKGAWCT